MNNVITIENGRIAALSCGDWFASLPCAEGYEAAQPLPQPKAHDAAKQCLEMGLKVGDTIIGRGGASWFYETKLTLLFVGEQVAAWKVTRRNNSLPKWRDDGEAANWTLDARKWYLANVPDEPRLRGKKDSL